jgi:hypothetical protein
MPVVERLGAIHAYTVNPATDRAQFVAARRIGRVREIHER